MNKEAAALLLPAAAEASAAAAAVERSGAWSDWLRAHLDARWRPGEWDAQRWLFTGDLGARRTSSASCRTDRCTTVVPAAGAFCTRCREERCRTGLPAQGFAATFVPYRIRSMPRSVTIQCKITRDGLRCVRPRHCLELCAAHYGAWKYHQRRGSLERWLRDDVQPYLEEQLCLVSDCPGRSLHSRGLCNFHWRAWSAGNRDAPLPVPAEQWARNQEPNLSAHQFSLLPLAMPLRLEMLYAVQQMDQWAWALEPHWIRGVARDLAHAPTLLDEGNLALLNRPHQSAVRTLQSLQSAARHGFAEFSGITLIDRDVLDLRVLGLRHITSGKRRHLPGSVDLRVVTQLWLRQALRHWVTTANPTTQEFQRTLQATTIVTRALAGRPDGGAAPEALGFADASLVVDAFRTALKRDGSLYSSAFRRTLVGVFFQLIDYGRRCGTLESLAGTFTRVPVEHVISADEPNEEFLGKAVPESVIRQLDAQLETLGTGNTYGMRDIAEADRQLLYRTIYIVLRDTGRRPVEIASLARDCLETHQGQVTLVWDNHKRKRLRRRLPIAASTAKAIREWQERRDQLHLSARGDRYLFPALTIRSGSDHIPTSYISDTLRLWVDNLPELHAEGVDDHGDLLAFDRTLIYPYAFRHSYAQRHADAGTPVDVLRELMDHKSIAMTQRYYTVSLTRKREAVTKLSAHVVDRLGRPSPCSGDSYQLRQVAVPFGGCTEPSNVKAGGQACPIRFQCAGCGFYRPDPSYLPTIEQHINELRADRETALAMGVADFITDGFTAQITAYQQAVDQMRRQLQSLPADERAQIEEASTVLRRARAGSGHTLLPMTPVHRDETP